jgi:hypothetical protein
VVGAVGGVRSMWNVGVGEKWGHDMVGVRMLVAVSPVTVAGVGGWGGWGAPLVPVGGFGGS